MPKLSDTVFVVLLTLGQTPGQALHGYALLQRAKDYTGITLQVGALYTQLASLVARGLIEEVEGPGLAEAEARRRYYRLTPLGQKTCSDQVRRQALLARRILQWQEAHP